MARKGLAQANILRSNNTTTTGYGIVYADEVSGHRTVKNLAALYALYAWRLSASGDNTDNDAIGQLWYVVDADGNGNGSIYQLTNWSNRESSAGWTKFTASSSGGGTDITIDTALSLTSTNPVQNKVITKEFDDALTSIAAKMDTTTANNTFVKNTDLESLTSDEIDTIWSNA